GLALGGAARASLGRQPAAEHTSARTAGDAWPGIVSEALRRALRSALRSPALLYATRAHAAARGLRLRADRGSRRGRDPRRSPRTARSGRARALLEASLLAASLGRTRSRTARPRATRRFAR